MSLPEHLAHDLKDAWAELERQGAVVHRVPLSRLSRGDVAVLLWHERRRLRALMERHAPDPVRFDWRAYRRHQLRGQLAAGDLYRAAWRSAA